MRLQRKILILIIITLITVLSFYSYYIISTMKEQMISNLKNSALILAESLEKSIVTSGAINNPILLQNLVVEFNKVEEIHEVYVVNKNYKIIAHPNIKEIGDTYNNEDARIAIEMGENATELKKGKNGEELFDVVIPLVADGKIVGAIEVELEFDKISKMINVAKEKAIISIIITILILTLSLLVMLFKLIIKPIENLVIATNEIAAGSFSSISPPKTDDEIGQLTKAFNKMISSLEKLSKKDKSSNPLTGLPGNIIIKEELDKKISEKKPFSVLYIDLDTFKEFNDTYGFEHGDEIIKLTAKIVQDAVIAAGEETSFVGHIGGDDFIAIVPIDKGEVIAQKIVNNFDEKIKATNIELGNRPTISVGNVEVSPGKIQNSLELGEIAASIKKKAKSQPYSCYLTEKI